MFFNKNFIDLNLIGTRKLANYQPYLSLQLIRICEADFIWITIKRGLNTDDYENNGTNQIMQLKKNYYGYRLFRQVE